MKIKGRFVRESGQWSEKEQKYVNKKETIYYGDLNVRLKSDSDGKAIVAFEGGPTGYEAYYLTDLQKGLKSREPSEEMSICAGTINRWDACYVKISDVKKFIDKAFFE